MLHLTPGEQREFGKLNLKSSDCTAHFEYNFHDHKASFRSELISKISSSHTRGTEEPWKKNAIKRYTGMWFSKAGMSCAEPEKLDSSPGRYNSACPVRKRWVLTDIHANRVFVCWSPLACLQGAGASWLLRFLVPSFRSSPVMQQSTETADCSVQKPCLSSKWGFQGTKK